MADVVSYALSLEFTLQDKATEVLKNISSLATEVEQKIAKAQKSLSEIGGVGATAFAQIGNQATKTIAGLGLIPDKIQQIEESISRVNAIDFMEDDIETVGKAADAARNLEIQYNSLLKAQHELELQGKSASAQELKTIEKLSTGLENSRGKQLKLESAVKKQSDKMSKDLGVNLKKENVGWLKRFTMSKAQKKEYGNLINLQLKQAKIAGAPDAEVKRLTKAKSALGGFAEENDPAQKKVSALSKGMGLLTSAVSGLGNVLAGVGLGAIVQATTLTGLFEVAIMGAAKRQEQFHTANFRTIGSQEKIVASTTAMREKYKVLAPEIDAATVALTEMGYKDEDIFDLAGANANFTRVTGASAAATARFSKMMKGASKDTTVVKNQLLIATRYSKEWGVSGRDNDEVLQEVARSALFMGTSGGKSTEQYAQQLYKAAAAAKNLGLDVKAATDMVSKMKDPLKTIVFLGAESLKWTTAKRSEEMAKKAQEHIKMLEGAADEEERWIVRQQLLAEGYDDLGYNIENIDDGIKLLAETENVAAKAAKKALDVSTKTPLEEAQNNATEASNLLRESLVAVDKVLMELQAAASPILKWITEWIMWFNANPMIAKWAAVGVAAVAALGGILIPLGSMAATIASLGAGGGIAAIGAAFSAILAVGAIAAIAAGIALIGYHVYAWVDGLKEANKQMESNYETINKTKAALKEANLLGGVKGATETELDKMEAMRRNTIETAGSFKQLFGISQKVSEYSRLDAAQKAAFDRKYAEVKAEIIKQSDETHKKTMDKGAEAIKVEQKKVEEFVHGRGKEVVAGVKAQETITGAIEKAQATEQKAQKVSEESAHETMQKIVKDSGIGALAVSDAMIDFPAQMAALEKERIDVLGIMGPPEADMGLPLAKPETYAERMLSKLTTESSLADSERILPKTTVKPETVTTSKIDEGTARPRSELTNASSEKQTDELRNLGTIITKIMEKFDPKVTKDILELLRSHLPEISDGRDSGLATPANQWIA